jgi:cytochrome P450 family 135
MPLQTVQMVRDPLRFIGRCEERFGPIFRVRLLGYPNYVYVTDPSLARQVYATDRTVGRAGVVRRDFLEPLVGENSLLCLEGEAWLRQRKLLGPAFHRRNVDGYEEEIRWISRTALRSWDISGPFSLRPRFQEITLEVILQLVLGVRDSKRKHHLRQLLPALIDAGSSPLLWAVPARAWTVLNASKLARRLPHPLRKFLSLRDQVDRLIYAEIADRRRDPDMDGTDVLSLLIAGRDEDGAAMSDLELRDELLTLLEAGHETTATALAWCFERLVRTPDSLARLEDDLATGGQAYLEAVVKESLRARSVVFDTPRLLEGPIELGGYTVPAGWHVAPALALVQNSRSGFDEPQEFRPERFLGGDSPVDGWIPFGGGKRHCVGSHLALLELRVIIEETLKRFEFKAVDAAPEAIRPVHVTLVPGNEARVRARLRAVASLPASV